jgi:hypothetical protein
MSNCMGKRLKNTKQWTLRNQFTFLIRRFDYLAVLIWNDATEKYTCYIIQDQMTYDMI